MLTDAHKKAIQRGRLHGPEWNPSISDSVFRNKSSREPPAMPAPPTNAHTRRMAGNAIRRLRTKNSESIHAIALTAKAATQGLILAPIHPTAESVSQEAMTTKI